MTKRTRWNHSPAFKAKVALATIKGEKTLAELARLHDVHPHRMERLMRSQALRARAPSAWLADGQGQTGEGSGSNERVEPAVCGDGPNQKWADFTYIWTAC
jgi:transposase-like protein